MAAAAHADVIVIGLGAMGSSTLLALARRGISVLGIDRFSPPHANGSSHGDTRITRLAVAEGPEYAPFVKRSHELWRQLEDEAGECLFLQCGGLVVGRRPRKMQAGRMNSFVERTIEVAREYDIPHEVLNSDEIGKRWPQIGGGLVGDELGCYEPSAGLVFPERCITAQLNIAKRLGANTTLDTIVRYVESTDGGGGVRVVTDRGDFHAARAIVTPGAWVTDLVPSLKPLTRVRRQILHWFPLAHPEAYSPDRFPVYIWHHGYDAGDYIYGFPCLANENTMKVATEQSEINTTADDVDRLVDPIESEAFYKRHVERRFDGAMCPVMKRQVERRLEGSLSPVMKSVTCLYTVTPDGGFIVDETQPGVTAVSACSGHGFKHSAGLGEALADGACGRGGIGINSVSSSNLDTFGIERFLRFGNIVTENDFHSGLGYR